MPNLPVSIPGEGAQRLYETGQELLRPWLGIVVHDVNLPGSRLLSIEVRMAGRFR